MPKSLKKTAIIAVILSAISSSFAWITEREAVLLLSPATVASASMLIGGLILLLIGRFKDSLPRLEVYKANLKDFLLLLGFRHLGGALILTLALQYTISSKVMFLTKIEPYLVVLWAWIFHNKKLSSAQAYLLLIHICGAILLSTGGKISFELDTFGDLLLVIGVGLNSVSYAPAQRLTQSLGAYAASGMSSLIAGLIVLPFAIYTHPESFNFLLPENFVGWQYLIITVFIFYVFSMLFWFMSLHGLEAWLSSALRCLGPIFAAPIAWIFYQQKLGAVQVVGAALVILTSVLMLREKT